jgi:putative PIN family toxin of toxin-antitoxin system
MINTVIDTNVIISAILSPTGKSAQITNLISIGKQIKVFYAVDMLNEYKRVLAYKKFNIPMLTQLTVIEMITRFGTLINPPVSSVAMVDESDRIFYDTAIASQSFLITGNTKHYPNEHFILTVSDFWDMIQQGLI